jgi:AcrR family transcriptional regulator
VGRNRTIDRQAVLDAAERVVATNGAANLTLDAVAAEASISKASVIYDYKTKHALIKAVIERAIGRHWERVRAHVEQQGDVPDRAMRGRIAVAAARSVTKDERAVALNLIAALATDPELQAMVQAKNREYMQEIVATSPNPRGAILAFLALEGLSLLELLGFHAWSTEERESLLGDIGGLLSDGNTLRRAAP